MVKKVQQLGKSGMFEGGSCHVKITQTFAKTGEGFLFLMVMVI
jgi:hypothetical protein